MDVHYSRRILDMLLIRGYYRKQQNPSMELLMPIVDVLFRFYHLPYIAAMLNYHKLKASDIDKTKQLYQSQCKGLVHDAKQQSLWKCLAYSQKYRLPILTLCIDQFCRDRLDYYYQMKKTLSLQKWITKYKVLNVITPKGLESNTTQNIIRSAMTTFSHRYMAVLQLPVNEKYDDSLEAFTDFIIEATEFIRRLLINDRVSAPFQIELVIIPRRMTGTEAKEADDVNIDDDDDDFDDDDDDTDSDTDSTQDTDDVNIKDTMPNIALRLRSHKVQYAHTKLMGDHCAPRTFYRLLQKLMSTLNSHMPEMPYRHRLCIVVDRRQLDTEIFMYVPHILGNIPQSHVNEWYFESSDTCVIPGNGPMDTIRSRTNASGKMFLLSFHCEQQDELRCYLYTRAKMVRFLPQDIYKLLPQMFVVESGSRNEKFIRRERNRKTREKTHRIKLFDIVLHNFLQQTSRERKKRRSEKAVKE